jgi:colicin import membrane protein
MYQDRKRKQQSHKLRHWTIGVVSTLLVIGMGFWFVKYLRASSQVARVKELRQQLAESSKLPEAQRRELWTEMRQEMQQLPETTRREMWQEQRAGFEKRMDDDMRKVLLLPPDQRSAAIDKQIDEMEKRRKEWDQRRQQQQASKQAGGGPEPNAGGRGDRQRGGGRQRAADPTGKAGLERTKRRLDQSTPEQRAMREEYRRLVEARRQQRGLAASSWPR